MAATHYETLLEFLKALGDDTRLKLACLLSQKAYSVGELAGALDLTAPTVSHHLSKLREAGLVNLGVEGNAHYYRLNDELIERVKRTLLTPAMLAEMAEQLTNADLFRQKASAARAQAEAWLDDLDMDEEDRKVLRDYTRAGRLTQIPSRQKKLLVVLRWLATKFAPGVKYPEREVNAILKQVHPDSASLRRYLIEFGLLEREGGGGMYWRAAEIPEA